MEKSLQAFDVCIICALPEEARALLEVVQQQCEGALEEQINPRYQFSYRSATLKNQKNELLNLHISWLPRYGPQEMTLHLSRVLEECLPRIAIMTGICAGDSQQAHLGDLVVAERTFTYDSGKFTRDEQGRSVHLHDTLTYQLDANILQFLGLFDDWKPLVADLKRPQSSYEQRAIACHLKAMASGSAVRADHPFEDIRTPVRGTVAIDMEGAAFGLVMSRHPLIRWLVVKGICDYADQNKNDTYHDYAAHASALYALSFIHAYVTEQRMPRSSRRGALESVTQPSQRKVQASQRLRFSILLIGALALIVGVASVLTLPRLFSDGAVTTSTATARPLATLELVPQTPITPANSVTPTPTSVSNPYGGILALDDPLKDNSQGYNWDETPSHCTFAGKAYHVSNVASTDAWGCNTNTSTTDFRNFAYQSSQLFLKKALCVLLPPFRRSVVLRRSNNLLTGRLLQGGETLVGRSRLGMLWPKQLFADHECLLVQGKRLLVVP